MSANLDLITIGRAGIDLYGEQVGGRLEDMGAFAKYIGGSPTNTAIGAARLGLNAALITRVGADHFGRFIREELGREGVDVRGVGEDPKRLTGMVVLGIRDADQFPLLFYRENCADMALSAADIAPAFIAEAKAVLISGTHLSTPQVFEASLKAAELAKSGGGKVVFDVDFRPVLWGLTARDQGENRYVADQAVTARLGRVAGLCDLIVGTEEEFQILGGDADTVKALQAVRRESKALLVCKRGALGCVAFEGEVGADFAGGLARKGFEVEVFNVLGAGDAFMSGFLRGWLRDEPLATALDYANACGAIVVSRHGCAPAMPTWPELAAFLSGRPRPRRLRDDAELEHLHWATTRRPDYDQLLVLAADGALASVDGLARGDHGFGVRFSGDAAEALAAASDYPYWIGRDLTLGDAAGMREWPLRHVACCRLGDDWADDALARLFAASRATRHELLLEVADAAAMTRIYGLGVEPDWWAITASDDWSAVARVIEARDPLCRGALIVGPTAETLKAAARLPIVKGFIADGDLAGLMGVWRDARGAARAQAAAE